MQLLINLIINAGDQDEYAAAGTVGISRLKVRNDQIGGNVMDFQNKARYEKEIRVGAEGIKSLWE